VNNKGNIQDSGGTDLSAQIVTAARARFLQFGYAKTSMQEIATACDMSAANLYRFYDGKLAIGAAVATREQSVLLAACDRAVAGAGPDLAERLVALFQANIDATQKTLKRSPLLFELALTVAREMPELRRQFLRAVESRIIAIMADGQATTPFAAAAVKLRSRMILMASAPFVLPWMMQNEPFGNPRPMVEPLICSLVAGLAEAPPPANVSSPARFS